WICRSMPLTASTLLRGVEKVFFKPLSETALVFVSVSMTSSVLRWPRGQKSRKSWVAHDRCHGPKPVAQRNLAVDYLETCCELGNSPLFDARSSRADALAKSHDPP